MTGVRSSARLKQARLIVSRSGQSAARDGAWRERRGGSSFALLLVSLLSLVAPASVAAQPTRAALEARIDAELRAQSPEAADLFAGTDALLERGDTRGAEQALERVERLVPSSSHPVGLRAAILDDDVEAIRLHRRAVEMERSAVNVAALARALAGLERGTEAEMAEAERLAAEARALAPTEPWGPRAQLEIAAVRGHDAEARRLADELVAMTDAPTAAFALGSAATAVLERSGGAERPLALALELADRAYALQPDDVRVIAVATEARAFGPHPEEALPYARRGVDLQPDNPVTHSLLAIALSHTNDFEGAGREAARARALGLASDRADQLDRSLFFFEWFPLIFLSLLLLLPIGGYLGSALFLLVSGWGLSRMTLKAASRLPEETSGRAVGLAGWLRWSYRAVLWLCCGFYYLSLPLLVIGIILLVSAIFLAILAIGYIPIKLMVILAIAALVTVWAVIKSVFVRPKDEDPGPKLDLGEHPRFAGLLKEVAGRVGSPEVHSVYLTAGTDIAVTERGGLLKQLRRKTERCLILGVGVLEGMSVQQLKAIIAHEHGHLRNEDTAGGAFALAVRRSMHHTLVGLIEGGVATKINPAWWFLVGFSNLFSRISQGASRLQEVLADRWAAYAYGSEAFVSGLEHVIEQSVRFDARAAATLKEVIEDEVPLANFYRYEPREPVDDAEVEDAIAEVLGREPSVHDSHPAPKDRIAWVEALGAIGEGGHNDDEAWSLFEDREALEELMTDEIRTLVSMRNGVEIPRPAD